MASNKAIKEEEKQKSTEHTKHNSLYTFLFYLLRLYSARTSLSPSISFLLFVCIFSSVVFQLAPRIRCSMQFFIHIKAASTWPTEIYVCIFITSGFHQQLHCEVFLSMLHGYGCLCIVAQFAQLDDLQLLQIFCSFAGKRQQLFFLIIRPKAIHTYKFLFVLFLLYLLPPTLLMRKKSGNELRADSK